MFRSLFLAALALVLFASSAAVRANTITTNAAPAQIGTCDDGPGLGGGY